jgi:hypothetical protein
MRGGDSLAAKPHGVSIKKRMGGGLGGGSPPPNDKRGAAEMKKMWIWIVVAALVLGIAGSVFYDTKVNASYNKVLSDPKQPITNHVDGILWDLENNKPFKPADFDSDLQFIDSRYDCSDFRLQSMLRILYLYSDKLDDATKAKIKHTLLNFKYWMDEPGSDGMCFWSENHQIEFATAEYLAGKLYPDDVFPNSGLTGKQHMQKAQARILSWTQQRWLYGFTEWYSNVYYVEDIAPMSNLIDFAGDEAIQNKMSIIMDLLLYDIGSQSYEGTFITTSGRLYEDNKKSGQNASTKFIVKSAFGFNTDPGYSTGLDQNFIDSVNYKVPAVLNAIAHDGSSVEIKASNGLDVSELKGEGLVGLKDPQIMMQWGMESFTNAPVITNSLNYLRKYKMFGNEALNDFKEINYTLLVKLGLLPIVSNVINPQTNGVAIQRANTYTYKTPYYSMATAQRYHPGDYGDQQQINIATLGGDVSIFNNNPAAPDGKRGPNGSSPLYWVGYGHLPDSAQDKNVNLSVYVLPAKAGLMEQDLLNYTHEYFPKDKFDQFILDGRYVFARTKDAYVALIGLNNLQFAPGTTDDLLQQDKETYWITELGSKDTDGTFDQFVQRIRSNSVDYRDQTLTYVSEGKQYKLTFGKEFTIDNSVVNTNYQRISSPYAQVERKPGTMTFQFGGHSLFLDFAHGIRQMN